MKPFRHAARWFWLLALLAAGGCVTRPPSIAHVHIGHAVTGVHVTPGHKGYVLVAEQRADGALAAALLAAEAPTLADIKAHVAEVARITDDPDSFGLKQSLVLAANHISFAATSADASVNVIRFAPVFKANIAAVIGRCDYIELLARDVAASKTRGEAAVVVTEIVKAAEANVEGDTAPGNAIRGALPTDYGMAQLRGQIQDMIAREHPAYRTVDEWYLFNLVRLPNGRWVFDKLGRGGNIDGYK